MVNRLKVLQWPGALLGPDGRPRPLGDAKAPIVAIFINQGRAIGQCPSCPGAELFDPSDPWFFCKSCYNQAHGYKRLPFEWQSKEDPEAVQAALIRRPLENRNFTPGETLHTLWTENEQHGIEKT